jgi:molybdopterin biosynthesis enzyme MoaB
MPAQARTSSLPDFTTIVEKSEAAVVNIRTTAKVSGNRQGRKGKILTSCFAISLDQTFSRQVVRDLPSKVRVDVVLSLKSAAYRVVLVPASLSRLMDTY